MNNTIDFNTAKTIGTMSKKIDHIDDTVSSFFSFMHMVMQNELGNAEPYFAATSPVLDLTVIRPDDAPHILPCFDEADEGISISEDEPLGFRYNPKQVIKLMGKRYLVGPVIFHRFDDDGNFASLTMSDRLLRHQGTGQADEETRYAHCAGSGLGACHGKPQQRKVHTVLYGRDAPASERGADCGVFRGDLEAFPQVGWYSHGADPERERPSFFP